MLARQNPLLDTPFQAVRTTDPGHLCIQQVSTRIDSRTLSRNARLLFLQAQQGMMGPTYGQMRLRLILGITQFARANPDPRKGHRQRAVVKLVVVVGIGRHLGEVVYEKKSRYVCLGCQIIVWKAYGIGSKSA